MTSSESSPVLVHDMLRALLKTSSPSATPVIVPPVKNTIRRIENHPEHHREKYDGCRWRLACTWHEYDCTNLAYTCKLCTKHNAQRRNIPVRSKKKKRLPTTSSLPILTHQYPVEKDDDIEIIAEYHPNQTMDVNRNSSIKSEHLYFNQFSIDRLNDDELLPGTKSEPQATSSSYTDEPTDIEYIGSKTGLHGLKITELIAGNTPPLTDFEEEYIATLLMENCPSTCSILDAQLYLHDAAISVVKKNYRLKMDTISPEYFYDFLLRHPRVALHYQNWFLRCKPIPPTTGCHIDTKMWTLAMMVRGSTTADQADDE